MHLTDEQILTTLRGTGNEAAEDHLARCRRCSAAAEVWRASLEDLRASATESVDDGEMHRLMTLFRHHRGASARPSLAATLFHLAGAAVGVRGHSQGLVEIDAGRFRIGLQASARERDGASTVHGQVVAPGADDGVAGGRVVMVAGDGTALVTEIDAFGEFHLDAVPHGRYGVTWHLAGTDIVLEELSFGDDGVR